MTATDAGALGAWMDEEINSQADTWERAVGLTDELAKMPKDGERVAIVGCGTSWFMAQAYQALREGSGRGLTDAFAASEAFVDRDYDVVIGLTRSGTTTEVIEVLEALRGKTRTLAIVGDTGSPIMAIADETIGLPFADERSVVQTRFATTALAFLRASTGVDMTAAIADARTAIAEEIPAVLVGADQYSFLGRGWTVGLAHEAALKMREAAQAWTESYPAKEYRHGPIAIAAPGRVTWLFGEMPTGLDADIAHTGAHFERSGLDPMADLIRAQRVALASARAQGLNPDAPRNLTRSVILDA